MNEFGSLFVSGILVKRSLPTLTFANFKKIIIYDWLVKSCDIDVFKLGPFSLKFRLLFKAPLLASIYHAET